jgi:formamidopyrimidine-DNA glycosylase
MLSGRFRYVTPNERMAAKTCYVVTFENGYELRYIDDRLMGKTYPVRGDEMEQVPQWSDLGPDVLDPELTEEAFLQRIRRYTGQIKNVLLNQSFIAGIGNAYADEVLFAAGIHPYRKRTKITPEELSRLYHTIHEVMAWASAIVGERMENELLPRDEVRDFLRVHQRGGQPCPNCGSPITQIGANQRITNFCRHCQS